MKIKSLYFLIGLGLLFSCTKEAPIIENKESILSFSGSIEKSGVYQWVEQLYDIHINDTPLSNEGYPPGELFPSGHLTRSAVVGAVAGALSDMGYKADTIQLGNEPHIAYNVVAEQKGALFPEEVVLVACHLDAFYGGADDNTSAVAAMLEIARAARSFSFARTIRFAAFDLEELGSVGSTRYIEAGYASDVSCAIVMDLIGYSSAEPDSQKDIFGVTTPDTGDFIFVVGNRNSSDAIQSIISLDHTASISKSVGVIAPGDGTYFMSSVFMRSDHGLMWYKGIPAIFFTDGANYRNPNYHKISDKPETLNKDFLGNNTKLVAAAVALLAEIQP